MDFPEPERPTMATNSPRSMRSEDVRDGTDYGRAGPIVLLQTRGEQERLWHDQKPSRRPSRPSRPCGAAVPTIS